MDKFKDPETKEEELLRMRAAGRAASDSPSGSDFPSANETVAFQGDREPSDPCRAQENRPSAEPISDSPPADPVPTPNPASALRRISAFALDLLIVGLLSSVLLFPALLFLPAREIDPNVFGLSFQIRSLLGLLGASALPWLYFAVFESSPMQCTPAARLLGMKVLDANYGSCGFWRSSLYTFANLFWVVLFWQCLVIAQGEDWFYFPALLVLTVPAIMHGVILLGRRSFLDRICERNVVMAASLPRTDAEQQRDVSDSQWLFEPKLALFFFVLFSVWLVSDFLESISLQKATVIVEKVLASEHAGKSNVSLRDKLPRKDKAVACGFYRRMENLSDDYDDPKSRLWAEERILNLYPDIHILENYVVGLINEHQYKMALVELNRLASDYAQADTKRLSSDVYRAEGKYREALKDFRSYMLLKYRAADQLPVWSDDDNGCARRDYSYSKGDFLSWSRLAAQAANPQEKLRVAELALQYCPFAKELYQAKAEALRDLQRDREALKCETIVADIERSTEFQTAVVDLPKPVYSAEAKDKESSLKKSLSEECPKTLVYLALSYVASKPGEKLEFFEKAKAEDPDLLFSLVPSSAYHFKISSLRLNIAGKRQLDSKAASAAELKILREEFGEAGKEALEALSYLDVDIERELALPTGALSKKFKINIAEGVSSVKAVQILDLDQRRARILQLAESAFSKAGNESELAQIKNELQALVGTDKYAGAEDSDSLE